jgi:hypothetical protein
VPIVVFPNYLEGIGCSDKLSHQLCFRWVIFFFSFVVHIKSTIWVWYMLFLCTRLGMVVTQLGGKTISLDDELSILQGIVKLVGPIFLAKVSRLWSVLTLNMIVKNYHVAEEKCVCVCVCVLCKRERDHKFFTSLSSMKVFDSTMCEWKWIKAFEKAMTGLS